MNTDSPKKQPGYQEAIALLGGLWLGLLIFQVAAQPKCPLLGASSAATLAFLPLLGAYLAGYFFPERRIIRFLTGIPFAITAVACTSLASLLGTLILQNPSARDAQKLGAALPYLQKLALTDVFHSAWFGGLVFALILCLGLTSGRRSRPLSVNNLVFLCTHLGTAIVLAGGVFSNFTAQSGMIALEMDQPNAQLQAEDGQPLSLPSPLTLKAFAVDPFPLEAVLGTANDQSAAHKRGGRSFPYLEPGRTFQAKGWAIQCLEALPQAEIDTQWVESANGRPAIDVILRSHGTESRIPLTTRSGMITAPGGVILGMVEVPEGRIQAALRHAKPSWEKEHAPGILYVTDGRQLVALSRDLTGLSTEHAGSDAMKPLEFGKLTLTAGRLYLADMATRYKASSGLQTEPLGAAKILAKKGTDAREGWIAAGPRGVEWLNLEGDTVLMLLPPQPKTYRSDVLLNGQSRTIRVNHPLEFEGWQLTQTSWQVDPEGRPVSILRAMKDPSIPVVWTGLCLLMLGTLGALWILPGLLKPEAAPTLDRSEAQP